LILALAAATPAAARIMPFPSGFEVRSVDTNGVRLHVRMGGRGPAVLLLHGYGETGDMWAPMAADLARDHRVIVPDLRGMGLSSRPPDGYDKRTQAIDMAGLLDALGVRTADLVTHDIGNMVGYALAAQFPDRISRFVLIDAALPGIGPWEEILRNPLLWHFRFGGPDMERLVAGRERIYLDRFWNEFSHDPRRFSEAAREHYAGLYAQPGAMHAGFAQFAAFDQDAIDNRAFLARGRLQMPVLALGGEHSFGEQMATLMRLAADNVSGGIVPDSGHWIMEENPAATVAAVRAFLDQPIALTAVRPTTATAFAATDQVRLTSEMIERRRTSGAGAGTSGVQGVEMIVLHGDPTAAGPYTIRLNVPPGTHIPSHRHRDARSAVVVSGRWYFGYGGRADEAQAEALGPGSFYTEPADQPHFAFTRGEPAVVYVSGNGPSDTVYVEAADDPR
jgi:pimeloyl-ACP methyl ester carboxylesterase/quercetin dioxygenase-like cupin family protein